MIKLVITETYSELSKFSANAAAACLKNNSDAQVVLPTGNTPLGMYRELIDLNNRGAIDLSRFYFVQLDEYTGIDKNDRRNLFCWMRDIFITPAGIDENRFIRFDPMAEDFNAEAKRIENTIVERGGIGLQILGLGPNGHLGFNEPGTPFDAPIHHVTLSKKTIESNARYWGNADLVPRKAFTLGLGTLSQASQTILLVSSGTKARILVDFLEGPVGPGIPATALRQMRNVTVVADREASELLSPATLSDAETPPRG